MRSQALNSASVRLGALRLLLLAVFVVLAGRATQLTMVSEYAVAQGLRQIHARISLPPARGLILDRNQKELAISVDAPSVYIVTPLVQDVAGSAAKLASVLKLDRRALEKRITDHKGFMYVARWVGKEQAQQIQALGLPGVGIELEPRRRYPAGRLAASLLGFADIDANGVRGLEQMLDEWLKGEPRTVAVERDASGRLLCSNLVNPLVTAGGDVVLSIDAGLQAEAEEALALAVRESGSLGGLVIAIDPKTGDVLSLAEAPGYDPNDFRHTAYEQTRSRAFLDVVEPGSTMKPFVVAAALDAGVIEVNSRIDTGEGWLRVPGKTIRDHHPYGVIDPAGVLRFSSNVGTVKIAQLLGPEAHHAALQRFGFGRSSQSGFPSETAGLLRDWRKWKSVDHATVAFGQGLSVTPIQLAMAIAALANDGELMQPRLVLATRRPTERWQASRPISVGQAITPVSARAVLAMLETVVSGQGTGRLAGLAGVQVAGKTGTAQKLDRETGRYSQTRFTAWFAGFAPADDPRVAIVVALDEPSVKAHTGGSVAAPLFASVASAQLARQGIITRPEAVPAEPIPTLVALQEAKKEKEKEQRPVKPLARPSARPAAKPPAPSRAPAPLEVARPTLPRKSAPAPPVAAAPPSWSGAAGAAGAAESEHLRSVLVPDFRGVSIDSARRLAAQESLDLRVVGAERGLVKEQSPAAGTIVGGSERTVLLNFHARRGEG